ncbi:MAG: hypothetical protein AAB036_00265 [Elusimicrobiota bacterium]
MILKRLLPVLLVALCAAPEASPVFADDGFLPPNNLSIPIDSLESKGITHQQFNQVLDHIQALYGPIIASRGGRLVINRLWDDATVNASAQRGGADGTDYVLNMYGGLARHAAITQDGFALVACHELGHHIGGAPKYSNGLDWASNEGQADYFANLKCLRLVFADTASNAFTRASLDDSQPQAACAKSFAGARERAICVRTAVAGMSVTALLRALRSEPVAPRYDTPDPNVVTRMYDRHPPTQCRLDTYFSASLCTRAVGDELSETDPVPGACTGSQGFSVGLRPRCWYKPPADEPAPRSMAGAFGLPKTDIATSLSRHDLWKGL